MSIDNVELYTLQCERLKEEVESRDTHNFKVVLCPDLPIDVLNQVLRTDLPIDVLNQVLRTFKAATVIYIGNERMFHKLNILTPKVFIENAGYIAENMVARSINRYFNGPNGEYTSSSFLLKDCTIVRVGEQYTAPESALPLGASRKVGHTDVCKCELVQNSILTISEAETEDQLITTPVLGFVACLDEKKQRILCTQPKLPKCKYLIQGSVKYIDF